MKFSINLLDLLPNFIKKMMVRFFTDNFFDKYGLYKWKSIISKLLNSTNVIPIQFRHKFLNSRVVSRLYYSMFYFPKPIYIKDIILSIAIEALDNKIMLEPKHIIQFSRAVREYWIDEINENGLLRERLEAKTGKKIIDIFPLSEEADSELIEILQNRTETRKEFFKLYSTYQPTDSKVIVYLPNEHDYIDWVNGPRLEISINSFKSIDLGFFRVGYDYKFVDFGRSSWAVSISRNKRSEVVEFIDNRIGYPTNNYIWLR